MPRHASRTKPLLFAALGCLVTIAAAWIAYGLVDAALGTPGAVLAAIVSALLIGGPLAVVGLVLWGPQDPPQPRRPVRTAAAEAPAARTAAGVPRPGRS